MKKDSKSGYLSPCVLTFFYILICAACSDPAIEKEYEHEFIDLELETYDTIAHLISYERSSEVSDVIPIAIDNENLGSKQVLLITESVYLQDLIYVTEFKIDSNDSLCILAGKTDGFIKLDNKTLRVCKYSTDANALMVNDKIDLSTSMSMGNKYSIGFHKTLQGVSFFLKGPGVDFYKWYDINDDVSQNRLIGNPFFAVKSGNVKISKTYFSSGYRKRPKVLVIGDSFIEGIASTQFGYPINSRWCARLAEEIGIENCAIDGIGGDVVSKRWYDRLERECKWFVPEYVIISMGTNNYRREAEYMTYISEAIKMLKNNSIRPILVTVTPRYDLPGSPVPDRINNWVRECGELYVDINMAVTRPEDSSKWKDGLILPDGIHPTVEGYSAMYERIKMDCAFLFVD